MENKYIRLLQFLVGTDVDGDWGPNSRAAADQLINRLDVIREDVKRITRREEVPLSEYYPTL